MADKAYIVANKEQELEVLKRFEQEGIHWIGTEKQTDWVPSERGDFVSFPYVLASRCNAKMSWCNIEELDDETIVYDGRKVEKMYKVTQKFMNELIKWRNDNGLETKTRYMYEAVDGDDIQRIPDVIDIWWTDPDNSIERNNRLIAIIQWLNGEDVFELERPHKFVVRSNEIDEDGDYWYVKISGGLSSAEYSFNSATKFDTREGAQEWANSHQVVIEIDEEGNEV